MRKMHNQEIINKLGPAFAKVFGSGETACFFAPGRANLIGEHVDYNGGCVLPYSLEMGTYAAVRKRPDRMLRFCSINFPENGVVCSSLDDLRPLEDNSWTAYIKGVIWALGNRGMDVDGGMDMVVCGDLPNGAGLSSSASLEVLAGSVLRDLYDLPLSVQDIALCGQEAEREYVGVDCGIMDQFASAMGREDMAMLLDTDTLDCEFVPVGDKQIVVVNSGVKHSLAGSEYNKRRRECERAAGELGVSRLCTLGVGELESKSGLITDRTVLKRARHAVFENNRTRLASEALKNSDYITFGRLMNESHISLRDDYEVSCEELDLLAETAWGIDGVYGARMTGGGFGGCTVNLMEGDAVNKFERVISDAFGARYGRRPEMYFVRAGQGVREQKMIP